MSILHTVSFHIDTFQYFNMTLKLRTKTDVTFSGLFTRKQQTNENVVFVGDQQNFPKNRLRDHSWSAEGMQYMITNVLERDKNSRYSWQTLWTIPKAETIRAIASIFFSNFSKLRKENTRHNTNKLFCYIEFVIDQMN